VKDIRIDQPLLSAIRKLAAAERRELGGAIAAAQAAFGSPHAHTGAGLRKLKGRWYEVRAGLAMRLVFRECDDCLSFEFMGNHDDVQRFLKSAK
jgi:ribosomal protein S27AE